VVKPPISYFGSKQRLAARIVSLLPQHEHYVEPYCGSLSVLFEKPTSRMETVNDLDGELVAFWRCLRDRPGDLARVCALTPHSRAENAAAHQRDGVDDLELARRVWVRLSQSRGLTLRRFGDGPESGVGGWKHYVYPSGSSLGMPGYLEAYVERMAAAAARLHKVSLECMPALDLVAKYGAEPNVLLYVDPPYPAETRNERNRYTHEMRDEASHRSLAEALHAAAAAVVLSGYASDLYDRDLYAHWGRVTLAAFTGNAAGDQERTEVLWSNRPLGVMPQLDLFGDN
jgi:DNA adenine methylase